MLNRVAVSVECEYLAPLAQQMHQIAPIPASRIEHPHSRRDVAAQNLVEYVDVDLPELLLNTQRHCFPCTHSLRGLTAVGTSFNGGHGFSRWVRLSSPAFGSEIAWIQQSYST